MMSIENWQDDDILLSALREGDPEAFSWVFQTYADRIYRLARGLLNNEGEADCVVQDTFIRLIERLDQFQGRSTLGTWLYRVAYNLSQDRLRVRQPLSVAADEETDDGLPIPSVFVDWSAEPELVLAEDELHGALATAIETLPVTLRSVFLLRDVEGLSTDACAQALNISPGAVKVRLHRARLQLREILSTAIIESAPSKQESYDGN